MMTISTMITPSREARGGGPSAARAYRADIDGLRAVAVLLVVIFHATPELLPGGFAGVDIFFVISGFLITGIIIKDMRAGSFSLTGFYARRCRRILPALLLVMVSATGAGHFLLFADDYRLLGKHLAAGAGFISNIAFFLEAGYFDTAAISKPLLHLWSLAVEEQFYLAWPLILWLALKRGRGLTATTTLMGLSLTAALFEAPREPDAAFYLVPFRFWELMAGCVIALSNLKQPQGRIRAATAAMLPPLMLLSFLFLLDFRAFSALKLLLPVLAAAIYIVNGPAAMPNRILSHGFFVWLGKISYPLYLWHWPLLSFAYLVRGSAVRWETRAMLVGIAVVLADVTWRFMERPAQTRLFASLSPAHRNRMWVISGTAALALAGACGLLIRHGITMSPWQHRTEGLAAYREYIEKVPPDYFKLLNIASPDYAKIKYPRLPPEKPAVVILGDSIADRLTYGLGRYLMPHGIPVYSMTAEACQPLSGNGWPQCDEFNRRTISFLSHRRNVIVVLESAWQIHYREPGFQERLSATIRAFRSAGLRGVIVAGQTPQWDRPLYRILMTEGYSDTLPLKSGSGLVAAIFETEENLKLSIPRGGAEFAPILGYFCEGKQCLVRIGGNVSTDLVAFDNGHPTKAASDYIADKSLGPAVLRVLGRPPATASGFR